MPTSCPHKGRYQPVDPRKALPLPGDAIAPAVRAAIGYAEHRDGRSDGIHRGARAYQAAIALQPGFANVRRNPVVQVCGRRIAQRTVGINLYFPHAGSSVSLSYSYLWVSRFAHNRYRVWYVFH